jgi:Domain of unknown function (DUF6883)
MSEPELHPTRVPGAEEAVADEAKFTDYLLNANHPKGAAKARFFLAIGWGIERWEELRDLFLAQLPYVHGRFSRESEFDDAGFFQAVIEVPRENGDMVQVGTYWEVHPDRPTKFLTAYPV